MAETPGPGAAAEREVIGVGGLDGIANGIASLEAEAVMARVMVAKEIAIAEVPAAAVVAVMTIAAVGVESGTVTVAGEAGEEIAMTVGRSRAIRHREWRSL